MKLNNELELTIPEGFHEMDEDERSKVTFAGGEPGLCISNPELHIMVTVGWRTLNGFGAMLMSAKSAARSTEAQIGKLMQRFKYQSQGFSERELGGKSAGGFKYIYDSKNIGMMGETFFVKSGKTLYGFNYYGRRALENKSMPVWHELLDSVRWE